MSALTLKDRGGYPFTLTTALRYHCRLLNSAITIPKGFRTDLATIPWFAQPLVGFMRIGRFDRAAVVHDWLYAVQWLPRHVCDAVLYEAMRADHVSWMVAGQIWVGVRIGGWWAWYHDGKHVKHFRNL